MHTDSFNMTSFDKCMLIISNLPKNFKKKEILKMINEFAPYKYYTLQRDFFTSELQKFMFLETNSPADSLKIIKGLNFRDFKGHEIQVNYIKQDQYYCQATKLFLKKLPQTINAKKIFDMVFHVGEILSIVVNKSLEGKVLGYGSIQFYKEADMI